MIIGESVVLALLAAIVGIVIGVGVVEIISSARIIPGIKPAFSVTLFLEAFLVCNIPGYNRWIVSSISSS
jgi:putative ABC transport system permease protein